MAAIVAEYVFKRGAWLQHRAQILSLYAMFSLTVDFQSQSYFQILPTYETTQLWGVSIVSLLFNCFVLGMMIYTMKKTKRNPYRQELYTQTKAYQKNLSANQL